MNTPTVIIISGGSLEDYYQSILEMTRRQFHDYTTHFQEVAVSDAEYGQLEMYAAYSAALDTPG